MSNQYYDQLLNANFASDYKTPDWYKSSGLAIDSSPERMQAFFEANPQYAKDWQNITSGGTSAYSTDGTSLIKTNFASMSPQAAQHYAQNPYDLLAAEGFGHDPTLQHQAYYGGGAGIPNPKTTNMSSWMQQNRWTPGGIQGGVNNPSMYANTAFGAGYDSYRAAAGLGDSTNTQNVVNNKQPYLMGGGSSGGSSGGGGGGGSYGGGTTGGSASSSGGSMSFNPTMNPYLQQMGDMLTGTMTNNWQRKVQPQIASQSIAAGGYGGSRQGVAEANSANDLNMGIGSALANLYGQGYGQGLNYDLGQQNIGLGQQNLGLGYANLDRNINNDNLNWQMQGANFGLNIYDRLQQANQLGLQTGSQIQNTPYNYWQNFSNQANSIGQGYGTQTNSTGGNPFMGALGGAQMGNQIGQWWNSQQPSNGTSWFTGTQGMGD